MASWVVAHEGGDLHLRPAGDEAPDAPPATAPAPPAAPPRPSTDQIASFLPPAPTQAQPPTPTRPAPGLRVQLAAGAVVLLALAFLWVALRPDASPATLPAPSAPPAAAPVAAGAAAVPTATATSDCTITQTTATFYAPAGSAAPIAAERGQPCAVVGWHAGYPDWRQVRIAGSAPVWVPVATLSTAATAGPNLAPPPTPTAAPPPPIVIVEQAPPPPPAPTQCATVRGGGAVVQRCGSAPLADLQADAEAAWREQMTPATPVRK